MSKVVLITGATSGIGKTTAEYLSEKGYTVYGTGRHPQKNISDEGVRLLRMDLNDTQTIHNVVQYLISKEQKIDILINNAGVGIGGPIEETPTNEIEKIFSTNVIGPVELIKAVLPHMRAQRSGRIINITSIAAYMGLPFRGLYSASKGALELITEAIRMEVKNLGIEVINLAPGDFATDIALRRYHVPAEQSAYQSTYQNTLKQMNNHVVLGKKPIVIAQEIYNILQCPNPKVHYKCASLSERMAIVLKRILPDKIFEKLIMKHYKL